MPPRVQSEEPRSLWSRVDKMPPPRCLNRVMPAQSTGVKPSPTSTANSHSSSKSDASSMLNTLSFPFSSVSRSRAVISYKGFPSPSRSDSRCSRSNENRLTCQSFSVKGIVVWSNILVGALITSYLSFWLPSFLYFGQALVKHIVHIAVAPILARLERLNNGMKTGMIMLGSVAIYRIITAADVPAAFAQPQVYPTRAHFQAFLATVGTRLYGYDSGNMFTI